MNRRRFLSGVAGMLGGTAAAVGLGSLVGHVKADAAQQQVSALASVPPISITTAPGVRLHGIQTGWIAFKSAHYRLRPPEGLRFAAILTDPNWAAPKPMLSWVIEHPEGLIVVDSGERARASHLGAYLAEADPGNRFFIRRNFRVQVAVKDELGPQMRRLGLSPADVRWVVQTHLHFDHANGLSFFPQAEVLVSRPEYENQRRAPVGAVSALWPRDFEPSLVAYRQAPFGPFARHFPLTRSGDVVLVPTPGHSYGHQSVIVQGSDASYVLAGNVAFDEGQLMRRELGGIVLDVPQSGESLSLTRQFVASAPIVFLPSHDPDSLGRLARGQRTTIPGGPA